MVSDQTLRVFSELFRIAEERLPSYENWVYASAFDSPGDGTQRNLFTVVYPHRKGEPDIAAEERRYGTMLLSRGSLRWEEMKKILATLAKEDRFCLPRLPEVRMVVDMHPSTSPLRFSSMNSWLLPDGPPYLQFNLNVSAEFKMNPTTQGPVYSVEFPIYARTVEAIYDFAGLRIPRHAETNGDFWVLLPDFRAKILKVKLSSSRIRVEYEYDSREGPQLIGKLCVVGSGQTEHNDFALSTKGLEIDVPGFPERLVVAIMSRSGEVIDDRNYFSGSTWQDGIEFELSPADLEQVVLAGESETLEFKREIPKRREDIAISVVAMTNRRGGRILIGVDEETASIVGYQADKPEEMVRSILRENCDPPVEPKIDVISATDKRVVSITVSEGVDKPYGVKNKGIYIRSGSTNRIATRYELDQMYQLGRSARAFQ
jgi:hypothetical protein